VAGNGLILSMKGIGKSFHGVRALDQVDFELRAGEVNVLLGKLTPLRLL
jgi:ribose transport system ATP-binding protein